MNEADATPANSDGHMKFRLLCKLKLMKNCRVYYLAEQVDRLWAISPIYSWDNTKIPQLIDLHEKYKSYLQSFGVGTIVVEALFKG